MNLSVTRRITYRYIFALSLLAGITFGGHVLVQRQLDQQANDSYLVNYTGKQRYLSQLIVKDALLLSTVADARQEQLIRLDMRQALGEWERYHHELRTGQLRDLNVRIKNSDTIQALYARLEPTFQVMSRSAHRLVANADAPLPRADLQALLTYEKPFLDQMNGLVRQYEREARAKVDRLRGIERVLLLITLFVLLLEALLIFHPAVLMLRASIRQLTTSEQQMQLANEELRRSHHSLKAAQAQLLQEAAFRYQQQLNEQRIRLASVVQGQEEERRRLSRELHDGIGQMLTGLKLLAENIRSAALLTEKDQLTFSNLKNLLVRTIQETRNVSNNLMPPVLGDFGLAPALRHLTDAPAQAGEADVSLETTLPEQRFDPAVEIGLYRITQEALNNALKHANARHIRVELHLRQERLLLSVTDDGRGFRLTNRQTNQFRLSHGLHNMRERARLIDGSFRVISSPGKGTRVMVWVPISATSAPVEPELETVGAR